MTSRFDVNPIKQSIKSYMAVGGAVIHGGSELDRASKDLPKLYEDISRYGGRGLSSTSVRGIKDYATTQFWSVDGQKISQIIAMAQAPDLKGGMRDFVTKELGKINEARRAKGIGQIDLLGSQVQNPVAAGVQPLNPVDLEKEVQKTLDAILKVASTGGQSVSESTQAYTNRLDEMGKLRIRGMFNSFSGVPLLPVSQQTIPTTSAPRLGGV